MKQVRQPPRIPLTGGVTVDNPAMDDYFKRWAENPIENYRITSVPKWISDAIGSTSDNALISPATFIKNRSHHPDVSLDDYLLIDQMVNQAKSIIVDGLRSLVLFEQYDQLWMLALKSTSSGKAIFATSFRKSNTEDLARKLNQGKEIKK